MDHLTVNNLIKESQHGFLAGKSCATNLVKFMDKVTKAVDEGKSVDIYSILTLLKLSIRSPGRD
jgi:hypothetical protein